jgi:hypothetical protein
MSHKLPRTLQAVPDTLHARLEIADAMRKLSATDREDWARRRRKELTALRQDLERLREDLRKISRDFPTLFLTELRRAGFNPDEPRVPTGSGSKSGEWTHEPGGDEQAANPQLAQLGPPPFLLEEPPVIVRPPLPEFPQSVTKPPGPGWEWRGAPARTPAIRTVAGIIRRLAKASIRICSTTHRSAHTGTTEPPIILGIVGFRTVDWK